MRLTGRDGIARAIYVTALGRRIVVVRAFRQEDSEDASVRRLKSSSCAERRRFNDHSIGSRQRSNCFPIRQVKAEYDALAPEFEISAELIRARVRAGLTQAELAARMGTSQSAIARLESGQDTPSDQNADPICGSYQVEG